MNESAFEINIAPIEALDLRVAQPHESTDRDRRDDLARTCFEQRARLLDSENPWCFRGHLRARRCRDRVRRCVATADAKREQVVDDAPAVQTRLRGDTERGEPRVDVTRRDLGSGFALVRGAECSETSAKILDVSP